MTTIDRALAEKVLSVVDAGLCSGLGEPKPGFMCVEAAVNYAMGLPHGDEPSCVSPAVRRFKIELNDKKWSSNQARAKGLRRLAIAQLGSAGVVDDQEFRRRIVEMTIRKAVPVGLRAAAKVNPKYAARLEACAVRCEVEGTKEACEEARREAAYANAYAYYAAAYAANAYANADAAYAADADDADDADADAAYAANAYANAAAAYAAAAAAYADDADDADADAAYAADADDADADAAAYAYAAYANAYAARTRDRVLADYAEWAVQILIDLKSPGCEFLDLVPLS